ncbi:hypothetical protein BH20ACT3_BH20ACT3_00320 [soil metagenome]
MAGLRTGSSKGWRRRSPSLVEARPLVESRRLVEAWMSDPSGLVLGQPMVDRRGLHWRTRWTAPVAHRGGRREHRRDGRDRSRGERRGIGVDVAGTAHGVHTSANAKGPLGAHLMSEGIGQCLGGRGGGRDGDPVAVVVDEGVDRPKLQDAVMTQDGHGHLSEGTTGDGAGIRLDRRRRGRAGRRRSPVLVVGNDRPQLVPDVVDGRQGVETFPGECAQLGLDLPGAMEELVAALVEGEPGSIRQARPHPVEAQTPSGDTRVRGPRTGGGAGSIGLGGLGAVGVLASHRSLRVAVTFEGAAAGYRWTIEPLPARGASIIAPPSDTLSRSPPTQPRASGNRLDCLPPVHRPTGPPAHRPTGPPSAHFPSTARRRRICTESTPTGRSGTRRWCGATTRAWG